MSDEQSVVPAGEVPTGRQPAGTRLVQGALSTTGMPQGIPPVLTVDEFLDPHAPWRTLVAPLEGICAVVGDPIGHSLSPLLHNTAYRAAGMNYVYVRVQAGTKGQIDSILRAEELALRGVSVTMPGKTAALELADEATHRATMLGSANTLVPLPGGRWLAENTDVDGVAACLEALSPEVELAGSSAVVVGNGGTARPAVAALAAAGVKQLTVLARSERALTLQPLVERCGMSFSWELLDSGLVGRVCDEASVVISTVPVAGVQHVIPDVLHAASVVDVVYDPYPTPLTRQAAEHGLACADGLRMLAGQAQRQFALFTGKEPQPGLMLETVLAAL